MSKDFHINEIEEGCLIKSLMDSISSPQGSNLSKFKHRLAEFNCFFDVSCQRDACECFVSILNILHIATKKNLIDDDSSSAVHVDK